MRERSCVLPENVLHFVTGDKMLLKYVSVFLLSMVPIVELRGAIPIALGMDLPAIPSIIVCALGNMLPVPFIYFFARRILLWGAERKYVGRFFRRFLAKGERAGQKLTQKTGRGGLFVALMLFVGIPIPGTGAWTGTLGASFLDMGFKSTVLAVCLGVLIAGVIMSVGTLGVLSVI